MATEVASDLADSEIETFVILHGDRVVGAIQWSAEEEPDYRHASIDIYLDPAVHGCFRVDDLFVAEEGVGQVTGTLALRGKELSGEINAACGTCPTCSGWVASCRP